MPANHFVNQLGFNKTAINGLVKTYYSHSGYPSKQIYVDGQPVSHLTGILYYDFLIWFADTLSIDKDAEFTGGGRQDYAWMLRDKILLNMQGQ